MTFARAVFAFALLMLVAGIAASHYIANRLFGPLPASSSGVAVVATTYTATPLPPATATPLLAPARPTPTPHPSPTATVKPTATASPTSTATTRTVTIARYWVGSTLARGGQTVAIGYVIDNGTGRTARIMLGASIKSARSLSWGASTLSDPAHDVVAIVPPGVSTHLRYFTLPAGVRPGLYDVAWGLRNAATGRRAALVTAGAALRVTR